MTFVPQFEVRTPNLTAWVDLADPERRVVMEADSFTFHGGPVALERDCRRYDELVGCGWLVLRFAWDHVLFDRAWVADLITRVWRSRGRVDQNRTVA